MGNRLIKKRYFGEALIIILVFLLADGLIYSLLGRHYRKNFTQEKLEMMIEGKSKWKEITDDPCKWAITGDPWASENSFIKLNLHCPEGEAINTLDLRGVSGLIFADLLAEYVRIQGIDRLEINDRGKLTRLGRLEDNNDLHWTCFVNFLENVSLNEKFKPRDSVDCFYYEEARLSKVREEFEKRRR